MICFASPLFWQIQYLITNLSKKNFKTNVAELNQVLFDQLVCDKEDLFRTSWWVCTAKMREFFY
jgi:hypothetical protein